MRKDGHRDLEAVWLESLALVTGGVAHDLNNLLLTILGHAELVMTELPPDAESRHDLAQIMSSAERAGRLSRGLRSFVGQATESHPLDLSAVVESTVPLVEGAVRKKCVLELELTPDLPAGEGREVELARVVASLILAVAEGCNGEEISLRTTKGAEGGVARFVLSGSAGRGWEGMAANERLRAARRVIESYGGTLEVSRDSVGFSLPARR